MIDEPEPLKVCGGSFATPEAGGELWRGWECEVLAAAVHFW